MNVMQHAVPNLILNPVSQYNSKKVITEAIDRATKRANHTNALQSSYKVTDWIRNTRLNSLRLTSKLLSLCVLISISIVPMAPAQAQILKCVELDGSIIYSDVACNHATSPMSDRLADVSNPVASANSNSRNSISTYTKVEPLRETEWAHRPVPANKKSLDQLTIREARSTLSASDQAIAFLRQQTLASNR